MTAPASIPIPQPLSPDHPLCQAQGLWHPTAPRCGAVLLFRRRLLLDRDRRGLRLAVSACHRYELAIDGVLLARGPSRSDPRRWGVREVRLPQLAAGEHMLTVRVCHDGEDAGESQLGDHGFLAIAGLGAAATLLEGPGWRCWHDRSVSDCTEDGWGKFRTYSPVGAHETFTAADHPWGWQGADFDDQAWPEARRLRRAADEWGNLALGVQLTPEMLPPLAEGQLLPLRLSSEPLPAALAWAAGTAPLRIAAGTRQRLILDRGASGAHWPHLAWSGGAGATVRLTWVETPQIRPKVVGLRDRPESGELPGHRDLLLPDGGAERRWSPRWLRSGRHLVLDLDLAAATSDLDLEPVQLYEASFPFRSQLRLHAGAPWPELLTITDRTLRSCAYDAIWDCPHYEQCQFPGDSRVQAIAHYLFYGDDRLARKALIDLGDSQRPDGLLLCRAPGRSPQRIDTFTLQWLLMLDEFRLWRGDAVFVAGLLPTARRALEPFLTRQRDDGLIGGGLMAPFSDWSLGFSAGNAPQDADGGSSIISLLCAQACQAMAALETFAGWPELAARWQRHARSLVSAVRRTCLHDGVIWDTPARRSRSVHAQIEAIHAGLLQPAAGRRALRACVGREGISQPGTRYYTWHHGRAWLAVDCPNEALALLEGWRLQLGRNDGLATWPEADNSARSDCHGWGAYPVLAAACLVLGLRPLAPGLAAIGLDPVPPTQPVSGQIPTPFGLLQVALQPEARGFRLEWTSPVPVTVAGKTYRPGSHQVRRAQSTQP